MSSDSEDDFSYTNSASMLKALKKDISFSAESNAPMEIEDSIKNKDFNDTDIIVLSNLDDSRSPVKNEQSKLDTSIVEGVSNKNDSCIILSDEDLLSSPVNEKRMTRSQTRGKGRDQSKGKDRSRGRDRSRGKGRGRKSTTRRSNNLDVSVVNVATPAACSPAEICIIEDNNDLQDANYEIDVKVLWMSQYLKKFSVRRFDKMQSIFKYFAERENIPENKLIFTIEKDAVILSKTDTPESLNINAATIIEGGVRTEKNQSNIIHKQDKDSIEIKVQFKDRKRPLTLTIRRLDRMEVLMYKTAAELDVDVTNLKFYFDGDLIKAYDTVNDLQLEGGECIDCIKYKETNKKKSI